jgi:hypothetical protein
MVCRPKDQEGLGIEVPQLKNNCLLSKWWFKLLTEEGMWQQLLTNKYLKNQTLAQVEVKPTDSPFRKGLRRVKIFSSVEGFSKWGMDPIFVFLEDISLGDISLAQQYPAIYNIVQRRNLLVATVLARNPLYIASIRDFNEHKWNQLINLC